MTEPRDSELHFSAERLAAFLDDRLTSAQRDQAMAHFAACASCRREMTAARKLLVAPVVPRRGWRIPLAMLAAAALVFVTVPRLVRLDESSRSGPSTERAQPDVAPVVQVISPADRTTMNAAGMVFQWRAVAVDATYRLTLQDSTGGVLWETTTGDTTAALPKSVALAAQQEYFWSVDAQLADGRTAKADVSSFTAR